MTRDSVGYSDMSVRKSNIRTTPPITLHVPTKIINPHLPKLSAHTTTSPQSLLLCLSSSSPMGEMMTMTSPLMSSGSIPDDIALTIASLLEASDVCCLGSCSKFWRDLCASDSLWLALTKERWPHLNLDAHTSSPFRGWKSFYISKHKSLARFTSVVIKYVEQCTQTESIEAGYCLKAITGLRSVELGFKDVQMFMLARKHSVLLNLIGLQYCICFLGISPTDVMEALRVCQVADRQVCVSWRKLGRWFYGLRLPDDHQSREMSLGELAMNKGEDILGLLNRGAVHGVLRVQITSVKPIAAEPSQFAASAS